MTVKPPFPFCTSLSITKHLCPLHPESPLLIKIHHCPGASQSPAENDNVIVFSESSPGISHLEQRVKLSLQDGPGVAVLGGNLEGQGHALPGEAVIQRHQGSVHSGLDQVICKVLR